MGTSAEPVGFKYDVFISYPAPDQLWQQRLHSALEGLGVRCTGYFTVNPGADWEHAVVEALHSSRSLVVLWTGDAGDRMGVLREIVQFSALIRASEAAGDRSRSMIPIFLGNDAIGKAPPELTKVHGLFIGDETYAAGPTARSPEWTAVVKRLYRAPRGSAPPVRALD
jgi:TIR domain